MPLNAGDLQHVVALQSPGSGTDDHGAATVSWTTYDTVCAMVEAASNRDLLQTGAVTETLLSAVTIYYRSDVSAKHRVLIEGRTLAIVSIQDPDGLREMLRLVCAEMQG